MCVVSMIQEHYLNKWKQFPYDQTTPFNQPFTQQPQIPSQAEIDEFRKLLERAREYDKRNSEPDCELDSKKEALRELAKTWGIDISFIEKETV